MLNSTTDVKFKSKIPSQAVTGPGIIGKKLPITPIRHKRKPNINKIISKSKINSELEVLSHMLKYN